MGLKENLKGSIVTSGYKIKDVVTEINKRNGTDFSDANFSAKLNRESFSYKEVEQILDVIGYSIEWAKKQS